MGRKTLTMEQNTKIKPQSEWTEPEQTDTIGSCLIDNKGHFFRQDKDRVMHVAGGIINELEVNHIEVCRQNWGDKFEKITSQEFDNFMQIQLKKFFE